jgi:hypothetical protein
VSSWPPNGISARDDPVYQARDCFVHFTIGIQADGILVCGSGIAQNAKDLVLWEEMAVVQCEQQRRANRKRCNSRVVLFENSTS